MPWVSWTMPRGVPAGSHRYAVITVASRPVNVNRTGESVDVIETPLGPRG